MGDETEAEAEAEAGIGAVERLLFSTAAGVGIVAMSTAPVAGAVAGFDEISGLGATSAVWA
jgi:hypothetical protein